MSTVLLIIIHGRRLTMLNYHYRIIEKILAQDPLRIHCLKQEQHVRLDAGYILIDCNTELVINAQIALPLSQYRNYAIIHSF